MAALRKPALKKHLVIASITLFLAMPGQAAGPLAAILIGYVKQALKEKMIAYAKEQASGLAGEALARMPGGGMLAMMPGMAGLAPRPSMSPEAVDTLKAAGFYERNAAPLTNAEWDEYEQTVRQMASAGGSEDDMPDLSRLRAAGAGMPQLAGMLRVQLQQFRDMKAEQARMRQAYVDMTEPDRQEVVAELVRTVREQPPQEQAVAIRVLQSDALGLPQDLKQRLSTALGT